jgi:excisionase family DNA binding protein
MQTWGRIKDVAMHAGVSPRTVRRWIKIGLKYSRIPGGAVLIRFSEVDAFLEQHAVNEVGKADRMVEEILKEGRRKIRTHEKSQNTTA